jgi:hypothetical protein
MSLLNELKSNIGKQCKLEVLSVSSEPGLNKGQELEGVIEKDWKYGAVVKATIPGRRNPVALLPRKDGKLATM